MTRILDCTIIFHKIRSLLMSQVVCLEELIVFSLCWYCHIDPFLLSNLSFSRIVYQPQHMDHSSACVACWLVTPWSERTQDKGILKHKCGDSLCSREFKYFDCSLLLKEPSFSKRRRAFLDAALERLPFILTFNLLSS